MVRAAVPEVVVMQISGHKTRALFDRYNIVSGSDIRQAMQQTQAYLQQAREKQPTFITARKK